MPEIRPPNPDPALPEPPSPSARLTISVGPAQLGLGTAEGTVPPDQAHHLITTFGIVASASTGIVGAILTLRIAPTLTAIAYAELALALIAVVIIAICGRNPGGRKGGHSGTRQTTN
jgi:hypothetical protein